MIVCFNTNTMTVTCQFGKPSEVCFILRHVQLTSVQCVYTLSVVIHSGNEGVVRVTHLRYTYDHVSLMLTSTEERFIKSGNIYIHLKTVHLNHLIAHYCIKIANSIES